MKIHDFSKKVNFFVLGSFENYSKYFLILDVNMQIRSRKKTNFHNHQLNAVFKVEKKNDYWIGEPLIFYLTYVRTTNFRTYFLRCKEW